MSRTITLGPWQTLMPSNDRRFAICETRTWDGQHSGTTYRVRDAHTVSDADVSAGITARVAFEGDYDACIAFINAEYAKEPT